MLVRPLALLACALLLAGCSSSPPPPPTTGATPTTPTAPTPGVPTAANGTTNDSAPRLGDATPPREIPFAFDGALAPGACVEGASVPCADAPTGKQSAKDVGPAALVVNGTVTVTWTSDGPASDRLVVALATIKSGAYRPVNGSTLREGPSPLVYAFENVTVPDGELGVFVTVPCQGTQQAAACPRTNQAFHVDGRVFVR